MAWRVQSGDDSKLRGCDVVSLRVGEVAPRRYAVDRATIRRKKTGRPVKFEVTKQTRQAIAKYRDIAAPSQWNELNRSRNSAIRAVLMLINSKNYKKYFFV